MTVRDAATLKSYFDPGDVPTAQNYYDLIDSLFGSQLSEGPGIDILQGAVGLGGDSVLLYHSNGNPVTEYTTVALACAAASSGDLIVVPARTYNESVTVPEYVALVGMNLEKSIITGQITLSNGSILGTLGIYRTSTDADIDGTIGPASGIAKLYNCNIFITSTSGDPHCSRQVRGGFTELYFCKLVCKQNNVNTNPFALDNYILEPEEEPRYYDIPLGDLSITGNSPIYETWYPGDRLDSVTNTGHDIPNEGFPGFWQLQYKRSDGNWYSGGESTLTDFYNYTLQYHGGSLLGGDHGPMYLYGVVMHCYGIGNNPEEIPAIGDEIKVYACQMDVMSGYQMTGDRSLVDALNSPSWHANDVDNSPTAIHHTLGTGSNQAATGDHSHSEFHEHVTKIIFTSDLCGFDKNYDCVHDVELWVSIDPSRRRGVLSWDNTNGHIANGSLKMHYGGVNSIDDPPGELGVRFFLNGAIVYTDETIDVWWKHSNQSGSPKFIIRLRYTDNSYTESIWHPDASFDWTKQTFTIPSGDNNKYASALELVTWLEGWDSRYEMDTWIDDITINMIIPLPPFPEIVDSTAIHTDQSGEITSLTEKTTPVSADLFVIEDSEDSNNKKKLTLANLLGDISNDADAIHVDVAGEIDGITQKTIPLSEDKLLIEDSEDSNNKKKILIGNLPVNHVHKTIFSFPADLTGWSQNNHVIHGTNLWLTEPEIRRHGTLSWDNANGHTSNGSLKIQYDGNNSAEDPTGELGVVFLVNGAIVHTGETIDVWWKHSDPYQSPKFITRLIFSDDSYVEEVYHPESSFDWTKQTITISSGDNNKYLDRLELVTWLESWDPRYEMSTWIDDIVINMIIPLPEPVGGSGTDPDALHVNVDDEISGMTEKVTPVSADLLVIEDSEDSGSKKKVQVGNLPGGSSSDTDAIHVDVAGEISGLTEKTTPVGADKIVIEDSEDSDNKKFVQINNLPSGGGGGGGPLTVTKKTLQSRTTLYDSLLSSAGTFDTNGTDLSGYDHLIVIWKCRAHAATTGAFFLLTINNDTTDANYELAAHYAGPSHGVGLNNNRHWIAGPGASSPANYFSGGEILLENYADGKFKTISSDWADPRDGSTAYGQTSRGLWLSTAVISRIALVVDNADNTFDVGSRVQVIGIKDEPLVTDVDGDTAIPKYICIRDKKSQNTAGGTFTSGAWRTRDLNDEQSDLGNLASISSNQITLEAGTYICHISCPAMYVSRHQSRLQNITDASTILQGTSETAYAAAGVYTTTRSIIVGQFTLNSAKTLEIQHRCDNTVSNNGFGVESNYGDEIYTIAEFWKIG